MKQGNDCKINVFLLLATQSLKETGTGNMRKHLTSVLGYNYCSRLKRTALALTVMPQESQTVRYL
jgi:hypothetical protein